MTLRFELDLDMLKMYLHTKNEVSVSTASKAVAKHTHRHYKNITAYAGGNNICCPHLNLRSPQPLFDRKHAIADKRIRHEVI